MCEPDCQRGALCHGDNLVALANELIGDHEVLRKVRKAYPYKRNVNPVLKPYQFMN